MAEKQSITLENKISTTGVHFTENPIVELDLSYFEKIPYGIQTFMLYIKKLLLPIDFCYYYGYPIIPFTSVNYIAIISFCIFSLGIFFIMYKSKEPLKLLLFFLAFIAFSAFALNIIAPLAGIIADRLIFISSFFFIAFIFFIANKYILKFKSQIYISLIIVLTTISIYRTSAWKDIFTLLERDFERAKGSYEAMRIAANNYKEFADTTSNLDLKKTYLEKAILMSELGHNTMPEENKLLQYKAVCEFAAGKNEAAKKSILSSFRNDSTDGISYKFLGDIFYLENNKTEAIKNYQKALIYDTKNQIIINSISTIYLEDNKIKEANSFNDSLLKINPKNFAALENNGYTYLYLRDTINAEINFKKAFKNGLNNPEIAEVLYRFFSYKNDQDKMNFYFNLKNN
ncbi:MAG: hypothetical protein IPN93_07115 [Bacteroidetes bacterium]|nr:hypothetical protein [Bacteroidota bacterium]